MSKTGILSYKSLKSILLSSFLGVSGCSDPLPEPNSTVESLTNPTLLCNAGKVDNYLSERFSLLFEQNSNVGIADINHSKMHIMYKNLSNNFCSIAWAQNVKDIVVEMPIQYQPVLDSYMNDEISKLDLESFLYSKYKDDHCTLKAPEVKEWLKHFTQFIEQAKVHDMNVHFVDPTLESPRGTNYTELRDKYCHYLVRGDDLDELTDDEYSYLKSWGDERLDIRIGQSDLIYERVDSVLPKTSNNLIVYGAAHFGDIEDGLSNMAVSVGAFVSNEQYDYKNTQSERYKDHAPQYAWINADGNNEFLMTHRGVKEGYKEYSR